MSEDQATDDELLDSTDIEIDAEDAADIETAINEALAAVEQSVHRGRPATRGDTTGVVDHVGEPERADAGDGAPGEETDDEVRRLQEELADLRDRSARTLADFDNYRKRIDRERQHERRFIAREILREFLTVIDNLERALVSDGPAEDLKAGVELILRQMRDLLRAQGVRRVPAVGKPFDPNVHEAVSRHEDPAVEVPTVSEEMQPGYILHDRLVRPAIVKVAMPAEPVAGLEQAAEEEVPASD